MKLLRFADIGCDPHHTPAACRLSTVIQITIRFGLR
jgi:hypothetical protein